jgi:hypothetical protein
MGVEVREGNQIKLFKINGKDDEINEIAKELIRNICLK